MWDRPTLERNSAFEARIARLAAAEGATGPTLKRWAQGCDAFSRWCRSATRHLVLAHAICVGVSRDGYAQALAPIRTLPALPSGGT
jgi:hypothetical protein